MSFRFEKLTVWQESRVFIVKLYKITSKFPSEEKFSLTDQIRRAGVSIALNIAERSGKKSDIDFIRFLRISIGSVNEVVTGLYLAQDLKYLDKTDFDNLYTELNLIASKINALINSIKKS